MTNMVEDVLLRAERLFRSQGDGSLEVSSWPPERPPRYVPTEAAVGSGGGVTFASTTAEEEGVGVHGTHSAVGSCAAGSASGSRGGSGSPWPLPVPPPRPATPPTRFATSTGQQTIDLGNLLAAATSTAAVTSAAVAELTAASGTHACGRSAGGGCPVAATAPPTTAPAPGTCSSGAFRGTEAAVLLDGLERENMLLRSQVDRCFARETALRTEGDELRSRLDVQSSREARQRDADTASMAAEGAMLRNVVERQGEFAESVAARLEALQRDHDSEGRLVVSLRQQMSAAQADIEGITCDLQNLQHLVLPNSPIDYRGAATATVGAVEPTPMQVAVRRAQHATSQLRLACEAKLDTFGLMQRQLRDRLGAAPPSLSRGRCTLSSRGRSAGPHGAPSSGSRHVHPPSHETAGGQSEPTHKTMSSSWAPPVHTQHVEITLRAEVQEAQAEAAQERARADEACQRFAKRDDECLRVAKELECARRALRVREAEVKELQIVGKYFAGKGRAPPTPQELGVAELAEELRVRCAQLAEEVERLRSERDLLRAERDRSERGRRCGREQGTRVVDTLGCGAAAAEFNTAARGAGLASTGQVLGGLLLGRAALPSALAPAPVA